MTSSPANTPNASDAGRDTAELQGWTPAQISIFLRSTWLPAATLAFCAIFTFFFPAEIAPEAAGDHSFGWLRGALIAGGLASVFAIWKSSHSLLTLGGPFLLCFALSLLEQQSGYSAWHRCVPSIFGIGPDALLAATAAFSLGGAHLRHWAKLSLCASAAMVLAPVPVSGQLIPGILAPVFATSGVSATGTSTILLVVHLAFFAALAAYAFSSEQPRRRKYIASAALVWAIASGVLGAEGWLVRYGEWTTLGHTLTRVSVLWLVVACLWRTARDAISHPWPSQEKEATEVSVGLFIVLLFFILKWQGLHWSNTDENIYFYAAAATRDGIIPYRDYLFAHPPVRVLIPAIIFHIFGFSVASAQLIPALSASAAGILLWRALRRHAGGAAGLLAMALFFSASGTLKASTDMTGINMTCALALAAVLYSAHGKAIRTGVFLALAAGTGMIAIWWAPVFCLIPFRKDKEKLGQFLVAFLGGLLVIHGAGYALGGAQYVEGVFTYHTLKAPKDPRYEVLTWNPLALLHAVPNNFGVLLSGKPFRQFLYYHGGLVWLGGVIAPLFLLGARFRNIRKPPSKRITPTEEQSGDGAELWLLAGFCGLLFLSALREQYSFYWVILIPVLAALLSLGVFRVTRWVGDANATPFWGYILLAALMIPACAVRDYGNRGWPSEHANAGQQKSFHWAISAPDTLLDSFTASLFFKPYRVQGELSSSVHHYLWSKKRTFSVAPEIAHTIRQRSSSDQTITGASTSTPLIALLADRRLAGDHVDTNAKVFKTNLRTEAEFWQTACADKLSFVVATPRSFFTSERLQSSPHVRPFFRRFKRFSDPRLLHWRSYQLDLLQLRPDVESCAQ